MNWSLGHEIPGASLNRGLIFFLLWGRKISWFFFLGLVMRSKPYPSVVDLAFRDAVEEAYLEFKEVMAGCMVFEDRFELLRFACSRAGDGCFLEFGVLDGASLSVIRKCTSRRVVGFDSFEGLSEDWLGTRFGRGAAGRGGVVPASVWEVKGAEVVRGRVEFTLGPFLSGLKRDVGFVHLDLDCFGPTRFVLEAVKPCLSVGAVLVFDDFYGFPGWRGGEYRALLEVFGSGFEFLCFGPHSVGVRVV